MPPRGKEGKQRGNKLPSELSDRKTACERLKQDYKTLLLATSDQDGLPEVSYAPFVEEASENGLGCFYLFVSDLAPHTRNLRQQPYCSVLFIRDERDSGNLFARERLSYDCLAEFVSRDDAQWEKWLAALEVKQGKTVQLLKTLPDFQLFRLNPRSGRYVVGFGQAYDLDAEGRLSPVA